MLIGNNNYDNVYVKHINKTINQDKAEISNSVKEQDLTQVVYKKQDNLNSLNDFYQQKTFYSQLSNVNNNYVELKKILNEKNTSLEKLTNFMNKNIEKKVNNSEKKDLNELIDLTKNIIDSIKNNDSNKQVDLTNEVFQNHEIYLNNIMSTHNLMSSIIKQKE